MLPEICQARNRLCRPKLYPAIDAMRRLRKALIEMILTNTCMPAPVPIPMSMPCFYSCPCTSLPRCTFVSAQALSPRQPSSRHGLLSPKCFSRYKIVCSRARLESLQTPLNRPRLLPNRLRHHQAPSRAAHGAWQRICWCMFGVHRRSSLLLPLPLPETPLSFL